MAGTGEGGGAIPLRRPFFARSAVAVARDLVGMLLVRADEGLVARVVETEAYLADDPACHAYRRRTVRNAPLYGPPGHAYVYLNYGTHWCLNVSTGEDGVAEGVLIRAAEPLAGLARMRARRATAGATADAGRGAISDRDLLRGPGRLGRAYGLDGSYSGRDLCDDAPPGPPLHFADDGTRPPVAAGPRVGVSQAPDVPWRFVVPGSRWVSAYRRSPRAPAPAPASGPPS